MHSVLHIMLPSTYFSCVSPQVIYMTGHLKPLVGVLTKIWMISCWKSGLNIAKMVNLGQLAIKPLVIRQKEGRIYQGGREEGVSG